MGKSTLCLLFAAVGLFANNPHGQAGQASEAVTVAVTLPVNVPLQVPAGTSFRDAAADFVQRNGLPLENVDLLEAALQGRWQTQQQDNLRRAQCIKWQMQHNVAPQVNWGTLPAEARVDWLKLDCDSMVPAEPPTALVALDVNVDSTVLVLRAFEGDTIQGSVQRFCEAHGIDFATNGQVLVDALFTKAQQVANPQPDETRTFLFSIPFDIDGKLVRLRVHEGDDLGQLVKSFCDETGISEADFGQTIANAVLDTTEQLKQKLAQEVQKQGVETPEQPKLLLSIPINVDSRSLGDLKLYDGDYVEESIKNFCNAHGLDEAVHGRVLLQHITERTQALNQ